MIDMFVHSTMEPLVSTASQWCFSFRIHFRFSFYKFYCQSFYFYIIWVLIWTIISV